MRDIIVVNRVANNNPFKVSYKEKRRELCYGVKYTREGN